MSPAWRQLARRAKWALYRLANPVDRLVHRRNATLLPPAHLRIYYYGTWDPDVFAQACDRVRAELAIRGLRPEHRVLDIGSGIGNLALGLTGYLRGGYDGIEIHPEAVAWCQRAITPRYPSFRFHRADVSSVVYNPGGRTAAAAFHLPFADGSFDVIFLSSVFTHMLPDGVAHYVREIARLLAPDGICVATYFLVNDDSLRGIRAGQSFVSFPVEDPAGIHWLHDAAVPEAAVAIDEPFVRRIHEQAGLHIRDVRRGGWWHGAAHEQDVVTAVRPAE